MLFNRPLRYYESLYEQCRHLEQVLENDESIRFVKDGGNNNDIETSNNEIQNKIDINEYNNLSEYINGVAARPSFSI